MAIPKGKVYLVGAGPGDPALITRKGAECLRKAEVVIYDRLISRELLYLAPEKAEMIYVGKRAGEHFRKQHEINEIILEKAKEGKTLVRLKGGDPLVFGRGAEEAVQLSRAGISFEIVPGVTAAVAASAYAGIPLTHRDWTSSVAFITGHESSDKTEDTICWEKLANCIGTIAIYMGVKNFEKITEKVIKKGGRAPETPAAVIYAGTTPWQRTVIGTLENIAKRAREEKIIPPALLIIGEVVSLRHSISWHEQRPLFGRRLVVTRSRSEKSLLAEELRGRGSMVIEFPTLKISPPADNDDIVEKLKPLSKYDWIVFSSPTGVEHFFRIVIAAKGDARNLYGTRIAARDTSTAKAIMKYGIQPDFTEVKSSSKAMIQKIISEFDVKNKSFLIPQKTEMQDQMIHLLEEAGSKVTCIEVYTLGLAEKPPEEFIDLYEDKLLDGILFSSSTSVIHFLELMKAKTFKDINKSCKLFSIGPVTSEKIMQLKGEVAVEAEKHSVKGLADAVCRFYSVHNDCR